MIWVIVLLHGTCFNFFAVVDRPDRLIEDRDAKYRETGVGGESVVGVGETRVWERWLGEV